MAQVRAFRFGLIGTVGESRKMWQAKARRAEELGYSTFLCCDHFDYALAPLPALLCAAAATERIRLGTLVLANDFRHPAVLAKDAATLDLLSEGRLELGIGAGWKEGEYREAGIPFDAPAVRVRRLVESVAIIKQLWRGKPVHYKGEFYQLDGLVNKPRPYQHPHPPLLIGGARPQLLALAAREANIVALATRINADGSPDFVDSLGPRVAAKVAYVREQAGERADTLEFQISVGGVIVTPDRMATAEQLAPTVGLNATQLLDCAQALVGTEDEIVADLIERRERLGISYISVDERFMDALAPMVARLAGN
jgi:probable F420-dependent oxidoreductase